MAIIFLNGCTSAGKSSIARCLQNLLKEPYLLSGIDDAFASLPLRYHKHPEGFFFDRDENGLVRLNFGTVGWATLMAHQTAAAAMARKGTNLILDEVVLNEPLREGWQFELSGLDVSYVGVHCSLAELERREVDRGDRVMGQARGQFELVHQGMQYDLEVDSTQTPPERLAEEIADALAKP